MKFGSNISIQNKIILMVLAATFPALLLSSSIFLYNDLKLLKQEMIQNLTVLAEVVADNSGSSLIFDDQVMASKTLSSFKTDQQIVSAAIFDSKDKMFASYTSDAWPYFETPTNLEIGRTITEDYIEMVLPVILERDAFGKIYLHAKLYGYKSRKKNILLFSSLTFAGVLILAFVITIKLQGIISKPILTLAETATAISKNIDYSHRGSYEGDDEIGKLYSGFNEMLLQIEKRDNKLEAYGKDLEEKIIESQQYSTKLIKSESRFRQVILDAPVPMMVHDDKGDILMISRMWTKITGYSPSELTTVSSWVDKAYCQNSSNIPIQLKEVFNNNLINEGETEITVSNGTKRFWKIYSKSFTGMEGDQKYAVCMAIDITDRKKIEEALEKSEEKFRQLTENIKEVFWMENLEGTEIVYISPAFEEIWGISCKDLYNKPSLWVESILPEDRQKVDEMSFYKNRQPVLEGKYRLEFRIVRPDGAIRWILDRAFPVFNEQGEPIRICGISKDITDRKNIEEDLKNSQKKLLHAEKLSATGKLSASIAHEFNNPIYGIRNVLEMVAEEVPMDRSHQVYMDLAIKECNRMKDLILKLQDFHSPTSGVITLIDINKLIDETALWISKRLNEEKIILKKNYDERLPKIEGVFDQIKQVILNLLQNAEEAMPLVGGVISITTASYSSVIKIVIQDSGMGIDPGSLKKIFEPFYTNKSLVSGTGLGLSLSYGIIKAHGGDIEVESQQGHGTKFTISIPKKRDL